MPGQVADAVAVGVGERARVDLVDDGVAPPVGSQGGLRVRVGFGTAGFGTAGMGTAGMGTADFGTAWRGTADRRPALRVASGGGAVESRMTSLGRQQQVAGRVGVAQVQRLQTGIRRRGAWPWVAAGCLTVVSPTCSGQIVVVDADHTIMVGAPVARPRAGCAWRPWPSRRRRRRWRSDGRRPASARPRRAGPGSRLPRRRSVNSASCARGPGQRAMPGLAQDGPDSLFCRSTRGW